MELQRPIRMEKEDAKDLGALLPVRSPESTVFQQHYGTLHSVVQASLDTIATSLYTKGVIDFDAKGNITGPVVGLGEAKKTHTLLSNVELKIMADPLAFYDFTDALWDNRPTRSMANTMDEDLEKHKEQHPTQETSAHGGSVVGAPIVVPRPSTLAYSHYSPTTNRDTTAMVRSCPYLSKVMACATSSPMKDAFLQLYRDHATPQSYNPEVSGGNCKDNHFGAPCKSKTDPPVQESQNDHHPHYEGLEDIDRCVSELTKKVKALKLDYMYGISHDQALKQLEEAKKRLEECEREISQIESKHTKEVEHLEKQISKKEEDLDLFKNLLHMVKTENDKLGDQLKDKESEIAGLKQKLEDVNIKFEQEKQSKTEKCKQSVDIESLLKCPELKNLLPSKCHTWPPGQV